MTSSPLQQRALSAITWYQRLVEGRPSPCRFHPSCSSYAHEAFELHGSRRGSWLTLRRLVRCRPFGPSGFDPVPEPSAMTTEHPTDHPARSGDHHSDTRPSVPHHSTLEDC